MICHLKCDECREDRPLEAEFTAERGDVTTKHVVRDPVGHLRIVCHLHMQLALAEKRAREQLSDSARIGPPPSPTLRPGPLGECGE
jgi:hypothetical protein